VTLSRPSWRLAALAAAGIALIATSGTALARELTRHATTAESNAAAQQELGTRWERLTAGQIFPERAGYATAAGYNQTATRVGIAPAASCAAAFDPAVARVLDKTGCTTTLRATYADPTGTVLTTVAVVVAPSIAAAQADRDTLALNQAGELRTADFPGTIADAFTAQARETTSVQLAVDGPYVLAYTAGYADGRHTSLEVQDGESAPVDLGAGLLVVLSDEFTASGLPCTMKDIRC
jgi:hypothetical protein